MSNILIITAHPTSKNLTKGIADIFKTQKEAQGHTVNVVDLYKDKQMPYLSYETHEDLSKEDTVRDYYQQQLKDANEIIIIYPFWWGSMPAILKNWLDVVLTSGFAFEYGENGRPKGLLQGRSVRVITTCGAPAFLYCLNGITRANKNIWKKSIVKFCGMDFDGFHLYGGMDTSGKNVDKMFTSVKKLANS